MRRRLLGLLAAPLLVAQCSPQCAPVLAPLPPAVTNPQFATYAFLKTNSAGQYTRWSACDDPIRWQLDVETVAPTPAEVDAILQALASASAATGHSFQRAPDGGRDAAPGVEAVIAIRSFPGSTLGQGGGGFTTSMRMVNGFAYVDTGLSPGILRTTMLHEVGHMLGLAHVEDATQVMYDVLRVPSPQDYQAGDLEGLRLVGTSMPCIAALESRSDGPIEVITLE